MKSEYSIYHDEAFHDRKVTANNKTHLNIENNDASSYFYLMHLGFKNEKINDYIYPYLELEKNYKRQLSLTEDQELKGTTIKKKWFKYGIKSMNEDQIDFYESYMKMIDNDVLISVSVINQFELVFRTVFKETLLLIENHEEFLKAYYSFSKFLYMNKTEQLIKLLFDIEENKTAIKKEIKQIANNVIKRNQAISHKYKETPIAYEILQFIEIDRKYYNFKTYEMDYTWSFEGLSLLLEELNLPKKTCKLYIDGEEGFESIIEMLQNDYYSVEGTNSTESTGTRMTDMFIRIISAITHSLEDQLINVGKSDKKNKHDISEKWFELTERQFNLYKAIADIFYQRRSIKWTTHISILSDAAYIFFKLLDYMNQFESFTNFKKRNASKHALIFTGYSLVSFSNHLNKQMKTN